MDSVERACGANGMGWWQLARVCDEAKCNYCRGLGPDERVKTYLPRNRENAPAQACWSARFDVHGRQRMKFVSELLQGRYDYWYRFVRVLGRGGVPFSFALPRGGIVA